jgi:Protein of unknown function (DUF664)
MTEEGPSDQLPTDAEAAMLLGFLDRQRATFAWKSGGLDAAGLRATLGMSSMTLGGMLYAGWREAVLRARALFDEAIAERGLDGAVAPDAPSPRYVLVNMIEEYARHNGHADLIRESIDGLVGHDPPESQGVAEP